MELLQKISSQVSLAILFLVSGCNSLIDTSDPMLDLNRRVVSYVGVEVPIYVAPDLPTIVTFPGEIISELWQGDFLAKQVMGNQLTLVAWSDLPASGETVAVRLVDGRPFRLWVVPANSQQLADKTVSIREGRSADQIFEEQKQFGF